MMNIDEDVKCKVYFLHENSAVREVRRFEVHITNNTPNIITLKSKLEKLFPQIEGKEYIMYWIDEEKDNIVLTNNEEFKIALEHNVSNLLKIYIKLKDNNTENSSSNSLKSFHYGVECDECNSPVIGYRYKCLECKNYDLCEQCERKHLHSLHFMIRIPESNDISNKHKKSKIRKHENSHSHSEENNGCRKRKHFKCKHHGDNKCDHQDNKKVNVKNDILCDIFKYVSEIMQKCSNGFNEGENEPSGAGSDTKKRFNVECLKNMGISASTLIDPLGLLKSNSGNTENEKTEENQNEKPSCAKRKNEAQEQEQRNPNFEEEVQEMGKTLAKQSVSGNNDKNDWFFVCNSSTIPTIGANPNAAGTSKEKNPEENAEEQKSKDTVGDKETTDLKFHPDPLIAQAVEHMRTMGFHNIEQLIPILELKGGDIFEVLDFLLTSKKGSSSSSK